MATIICGNRKNEVVKFAQEQLGAIHKCYPSGNMGWEAKDLSDAQFRVAIVAQFGGESFPGSPHYCGEVRVD